MLLIMLFQVLKTLVNICKNLSLCCTYIKENQVDNQIPCYWCCSCCSRCSRLWSPWGSWQSSWWSRWEMGIINHHLLIRSRHITVLYEPYQKQTQLADFKTLWLLRRKYSGRPDWRPRWWPVDQLEEPCHCHKHYRLIMTMMTRHDLENGKNHFATEVPRHCNFASRTIF